MTLDTGDASTSRSSLQGASFMEVMIAALILMVLAIGSGAYIYHSRTATAVERNRRAALEIAGARLESIRMAGYSRMQSLMPSPPTYAQYYLALAGGAWSRSTTDPHETVTINGRDYPITTGIRYVDIDAGTPRDDGQSTYDVLRLNVAVGFWNGRPARVALETLYGP